MSAGGIKTLSITWIIPLDETTSAPVTVASPTVTVAPTPNFTLSPLTISASIPSVSMLEVTSPDST